MTICNHLQFHQGLLEPFSIKRCCVGLLTWQNLINWSLAKYKRNFFPYEKSFDVWHWKGLLRSLLIWNPHGQVAIEIFFFSDIGWIWDFFFSALRSHSDIPGVCSVAFEKEDATPLRCSSSLFISECRWIQNVWVWDLKSLKCLGNSWHASCAMKNMYWQY